MKAFFQKLLSVGDEDLLDENRRLRERVFAQAEFIRTKTNQLLLMMGTLPARPEEFDDDALISLDPIGTVVDALKQILAHEKDLTENLRLAQEKTQAILSSVGVGILVLDSAKRIRMFNQKAVELFSLDEQAINGKTCCSAVCGNIPATCTFHQVMESRRPVRQTDWMWNDRHFEVWGTPVRNRFGDVTDVVLAYTEVTERVEAVRRLREREQMYRDIFENSSDLIQCVQPDGTFFFVNRMWRETLGYPSDTIAGLKVWNIIAPDHRTACVELFNGLLQGQEFGEIETAFFTRDGKEIPVKGHVSCSFHNGRPLASIGMFRPLSPPAGMMV